VSDWDEIQGTLPLHALVVGWLYARWLNLCRWLRYALGRSGRHWQVQGAVGHRGAHILE
jgi:hypothetical protein